MFLSLVTTKPALSVKTRHRGNSDAKPLASRSKDCKKNNCYFRPLLAAPISAASWQHEITACGGWCDDIGPVVDRHGGHCRSLRQRTADLRCERPADIE